jgi:hypothetical protein
VALIKAAGESFVIVAPQGLEQLPVANLEGRRPVIKISFLLVFKV